MSVVSSRQRHRLDRGGRIDRRCPLAFTYDGVRYEGYAGDTLASALLANGVHLVGRSFKYHRPRGIFAAGAEEPNALVQLGSGGLTEPNARATAVELYEGLSAASQNCWPTVRFDLWALNDLLAPLFPAGFYYKTFMWPESWWRPVYERMIRRAAGLGRAPGEPDPDRYEHMHAHCDVLVVGAGPAGLMAALAAGRSGARVILADEHPELGGSLLAEPVDHPGAAWLPAVTAALDACPELRVLTRTTAFGYYDHNYLGLLERVRDHLPPAAAPHLPRQRLWKVRARQVVLATGALERPLVFAENDRPGIMLASAVRTYLNRYAVRPGRRAVVFTNNDSAYRTALDLQRAGVGVSVVDLRPSPQGALPAAARAAGIGIRAGHAITGTKGRRRVASVQVRRLSDAGDRVEGGVETIPCDLVCVSGGWNPTIHLHSQSRAAPRYDAERALFLPGEPRQAERAAGACNGAFALRECLEQGARAGREAAAAAGFTAELPELPQLDGVDEAPARTMWLVPSGRPVQRSKMFVDLQNDVTAGDLQLALGEGYRSIEHVKRYTTAGMGTDQGKTANVNALGIVAETTGRTDRRPSASPRFARPTPPSPSARSPGATVGPCSTRYAAPRCMPGMRRGARCSRMWGNGSGRGTTREPGRTWRRRWRARSGRCAAASASWTPRRSARSTSRAGMPRSC